MGWNYSEKVKQHFFSPRNVGRVESPDGVGEVGSLACGDALTLSISVDPESQRITDARFQTFGCGSAIASSSVLTELVKGKTIDEALRVTNREIADALGGLPPEKMHCSVMGREALEAAIADYRGEAVQQQDSEEDEGRIVCYCFGVTEGKIRRAIRENDLRSAEEVTNYTKAGGGCGACLDEIEQIVDQGREARDESPLEKDPPRRKLTNLQRIAMIQEILDSEVRPVLHKDLGDLELVDIDGTHVQIRMVAQCSGCKAAGSTSSWIGDKLREIVDPAITLEVLEE
ncbi:MAG: Fe-S cluster assembly protein NifU [Polyangia bacterium]